MLDISLAKLRARKVERIKAQERNGFGFNLAQVLRRLLGVVKLKLCRVA
jgi:hypothetical protein